MGRGELENAARTNTLWDANNVASYLNAGRSRVYQKAEAQLLPCLQIGELRRFDSAVVPRRGSTPNRRDGVASRGVQA
jgi:hypothetical protein